MNHNSIWVYLPLYANLLVIYTVLFSICYNLYLPLQTKTQELFQDKSIPEFYAVALDAAFDCTQAILNILSLYKASQHFLWMGLHSAA